MNLNLGLASSSSEWRGRELGRKPTVGDVSSLAGNIIVHLFAACIMYNLSPWIYLWTLSKTQMLFM